MKERSVSFAGSIIIFFILLFVFAKWGPAINFSTVTQTKGEPMIVEGSGNAAAAPDIAKIDLGIEETGANLKAVQDSVNKKSQNLVADMKKLGIESQDIKTISYYVSPNYDYSSATRRITGYQVSINYEVTIRDFSKIDDMIASVTSSGVNMISGVSFDFSDNLKNKTLQEARDEAVKEAKDKAEGLAKAAGITLGKIINISENIQGDNQLYALPVAGGGGIEKAVTQPDIQPGQKEIKVTLNLSYEVR